MAEYYGTFDAQDHFEWEKYALQEKKLWSLVAKKKRDEEKNWRLCKILATIFGALLQTTATQIDLDGRLSIAFGLSFILPMGQHSKAVVSLCASGLLASIPFFNNRLSHEMIQSRAEARIICEELESEIYKSVAGIQPYTNRDHHSSNAFKNKILEITRSDGQVNENRLAMHPITNLSRKEKEYDLTTDDIKKIEAVGEDVSEERKKLYMARVKEALTRREEKARDAEIRARNWRTVELLFTLSSALLGATVNLGVSKNKDMEENNEVSKNDYLGVWAPVLTSSAAAVAGHIHACRFEETYKDLSEVAIRLDDLRKRYNKRRENAQDVVETLKEWEEFVNNFEYTLLLQTKHTVLAHAKLLDKLE